MIWTSGAAKAAAGAIPQASAAARPRRRSDPRRFSLMVVLLLSQVGAPSPDAELLPTYQRTVAEYTPSARFPQPRALRLGLGAAVEPGGALVISVPMRKILTEA